MVPKTPDPLVSITRERVDGPTPQLEEALGVLALELRARREAETALRRSEAQFRSLVERLLDLVIAVDRDGAIQ